MNRNTPSARADDRRTTDVLVVGAGPTGLMLGCLLRHHGVDCTVIDRREDIDPRTRAVMVHAAALEILDTLGLRTAVEDRGVRQLRIDFHTHHDALFTVDFTGLDTAFPYYVNVPQPEVEAVLAHHFTATGGRLLRGLRYTGHQEDEHGVTARTTTDGGSPDTITARHLVGADGASSTVRTALGIDFPGITYPMSYLLAEGTPLEPADPDASAMYIGPAGAVSLLPLPHGTVRIAGPVSPESLDRDSELSAQHFQESVDTLGHGPGLRFERVDRIAHYQVHERLAERFTHGRTVLVGDAAHLNSPAGGQAMNTGFGDAWALAWRLAAPGGDCRAALLADYDHERRAAAAEVARTTGVLPLLDAMRHATTAPARSSVQEALTGYAEAWSQLYLRYRPTPQDTTPGPAPGDATTWHPALPARAGHRLHPGARVPGHRPEPGHHTWLHLPGAGPDPTHLPPLTRTAELTATQRAWLPTGTTAVLVRPDGHVARTTGADPHTTTGATAETEKEAA
ncbi:FAD-dependent oxidoreductase [Streptomyces sp. NRRL S-575]|uniref:FAD-dependent oxidoreductase n=1 Tax=Streptomyces sp. NRRL S-575 TaxID=1463915 RepID=UPI00068BFABD|nr:NAD(P)/FAD-dependent oxidoreductase [Streptomyces sp. NRRL S-575]